MYRNNNGILFGSSLLIAFTSGCAALLYQVIWIREFGQVFGLQVISMSMVLATFMMGLAIGSYLFGRLSDRISPARILFLTEALLGLFAIFFNTAFGAFSELYELLASPVSEQPGLLLIIRLALSFTFLLFPATLIGGAIPVLIKLNIRKIGIAGKKISLLYALYNLGAFGGAFLAGFLLIRTLGMEDTMRMGASMNLFNALLVLFISLTTGRSPDPVFDNNVNPAYQLDPMTLRLVLIVFLAEGFTTLAYEILWTRVFVEFSYDKSTYLYSVILMTFVVGLSIGALLINRFIDTLKQPVRFLGQIQLWIAILGITQVILAVIFLPHLISGRDPASGWMQVSGKEYLMISLFLLPPVILMGITFPLVSRMMSTSYRSLGKHMGIVGVMDTGGSIAGSLIAALVLLPLLGVTRSVICVILINFSLWLLLRNRIRKQRTTHPNLLAIPLLFVVLLLIGDLPGTFKSKIGTAPGQQLEHFDEAACGTVTVHSYPLGYKALSINSVLFAYNTEDDIRSHSMLALMPYFHHPDPDTVLVLGFGLGITASCFDQPGIRQIDVAEICPAVINASVKYFAAANQDIYFNPKVNLIRDDGRSFLDITQRKYDIITCDAIHPRFGNNLFTREYYETCREHLTRDGVVCQWMPTNWLSEEEYRSLLRTFISVFPDASLWYINRGVTLAVSGKKPLKIDPRLLEQRMEYPGIRSRMQQSGIHSWPEIIGYFLMDNEEIEDYAGEVSVNTDDRPHVEYSRVVSMAPNYGVIRYFRSHIPCFDSAVVTGIGKTARMLMERKRRELEAEMGKDMDMIRYDLEMKQPIP